MSTAVSVTPTAQYVCFAQISDCHLYADKNALHYGANVYDNLLRVLSHINCQIDIEFIVFTGDLTQDHSRQSYQNFVDAVQFTGTNKPIYFTPGNHDELELLNTFLYGAPFTRQSSVELAHWQLLLVNSKGDTPSGEVGITQMQQLTATTLADKFQFIAMHHHPCEVGYFIDRHGLTDKNAFYQFLDELPQVKAIACGHVHNALELTIETMKKALPLFTCPATSIQFDKNVDGVASAQLPAGYRLFKLGANGEFSSQAVFLHEAN